MAEGGGGQFDSGGGEKPLRNYINKSQATVAEWVALRNIFKVCAKETVYEGRGKILKSVVVKGGCITIDEIHVKRYFGISVGVEAMRIRQAWWGQWRGGGGSLWK